MYDKVNAVQRMQDYIEKHLNEGITLAQLADEAGYSCYHATRIFKELVGIPPLAYVRARRLSRAALSLRDTDSRVLDIALDAAFETHEGFTRSFEEMFSISPGNYRKIAPPLPLFMPRSARDAFLYSSKGGNDMKERMETRTVYVQPMERPARRLILKRGIQAVDYWGYCEEVSCDVWGVLMSIKGAISEPIGVWLPDNLREPNTSVYAQGVEVPMDYNCPIPEGMEVIELPACTYLLFHGEPYEDAEMGQAICEVHKTIANYRPANFGWEWADEEGPRFQFAPVPKRGYIEGRPVRVTGSSCY